MIRGIVKYLSLLVRFDKGYKNIEIETRKKSNSIT